MVTGKKASLVIDRQPGRLTDEERARALEAMQALKTHPRDLLPNRYLLEKARATYESMDAEAQEALDPSLFAFEAALERCDIEAVSEASFALLQALEALGARRG